MKKLTILICLFISVLTYGQNKRFQTIQQWWSLASPAIALDKQLDPLVKEIIIKTIPKLLDQDAQGAAYEVADAIYRIKGIKVLNKEYLSQLNSKFNEGIEAVQQGIQALQQKDYTTAGNNLQSLITILRYIGEPLTDLYIKKGILDKTETPECEGKEFGYLNITNNSSNPYDIYVDNVYQVRIPGKSPQNIAINEGGNHTLYAKQVSGYAFKATERTASLTVERCKQYNWQVP